MPHRVLVQTHLAVRNQSVKSYTTCVGSANDIRKSTDFCKSNRFNKIAIEETKISSPCDAKVKNTTNTNIGKIVVELHLS